MRSFAVFSLIGTLACAVFTSALPSPGPVGVVQAREVEARVTPLSVSQILSEATSALETPINELCKSNMAWT